jgi:selenocysteine lyase/cysteine desulfurase
MALDIDFVRAQFPAFEQLGLKDQAFFENAGGSYTCRQVIDRLTRFYRERKVQPEHPFEVSQLGAAEMNEARVRLAAILNITPEELSFGPSTTQNTYVLAQAFGQWMHSGDAIIVTNQDHEANSGPWRRLADRGIDVREWRVDPETGHLDVKTLTELIDDKVKLLCFPHCSNIVGEVNPVAQICAIAKAAGVYTCVDGVSYAPHGLPNVDAIGADIYLFSSYKTYGPHQGIMVVREGLGFTLPNQGHYFNEGSLYKRFTPAGPDHAQVAASAGMVDYIDDFCAHHGFNGTPAARGAYAHDLMRAHETELLQPLLDYLRDKNSVRLIGSFDARQKAATVAMVGQKPGAELAAELAPMGVMAGGGDFYGVRCMKAMGIDPGFGALRVSFVHYTTREEMKKLITALDKIL